MHKTSPGLLLAFFLVIVNFLMFHNLHLKKIVILQLLYVINLQLHVTHAIVKPHSCIRQVAHD
jgi:hypothetical protein